MVGGISVGFQLNSEIWGGCSSTASGSPFDIHISFGRQSNKRSGSTGLLKEQIIIEKLLKQLMKLAWEEPQVHMICNATDQSTHRRTQPNFIDGKMNPGSTSRPQQPTGRD
jgi:hypothetical protein